MAPIPFYDSSIGLLISGNTTLLNILKKASETPKASSLPEARLIGDMLPLSFQIQVVSNTTKNTVEKLTGTTVGAWEDNEKTLPELIARVEKTLDMLKAVDRKSVEGNEDRIVELKRGRDVPSVNIPASHYVLAHALPNFFFHVNTAYGILRAQGVELGKRDYLGPFFAPFVPAQ